MDGHCVIQVLSLFDGVQSEGCLVLHGVRRQVLRLHISLSTTLISMVQVSVHAGLPIGGSLQSHQRRRSRFHRLQFL